LNNSASSKYLNALDKGLSAASIALPSPQTKAAVTATRKAIQAVEKIKNKPEIFETYLTIIIFIVVSISVLTISILVSIFVPTVAIKETGFRSGSPTVMCDAPDNLLPVFMEAQNKYNVSWAVLAAIARIESGYGQGEVYKKRNGVSPAGAVGFMQFLPTTWSGGNNPKASNNPDNPTWDDDPVSITQYGGYGTDGDGDGKADPYNPIDAVFAAASYLKANGFETDARKAIWHYNHADWYVNDVLALAESFSSTYMPIGDGIWPLPKEYTNITSPFGNRNDPLYGDIRFHEGIDISAPEGTPVFAVKSGRVVTACWKGGYGKCIEIYHDDCITLYAHLSEILVPENGEINQGDIIGKTGSTGKSTGPHLHFGVYINGQFCNPEEWLKAGTGNY